MLSLVVVVLAFAAWSFMFLPERRGLWMRTWVSAAVLIAASIAVLVATDRLDSVLGPLNATEAGIGLAVGAAWLVATHVGYRVIAALWPGFGEQVADLYRIEAGNRPKLMIGPVVVMGVAEELVFRGVVQDRDGIVIAVVAYAAVQIVERKWSLVLAAVLGGTVWGLLFAWRGGLLAPVVAHVVWTATLTFLWKLPASRHDWTPDRERKPWSRRARRDGMRDEEMQGVEGAP